MRSCRICAGTKSLVDLFNPKKKELIDIIKKISNVDVSFLIFQNRDKLYIPSAFFQIKPDDKLPKHICEECKEGLEKTNRLRVLGEANEKRFRAEMGEDDITDEEVSEADIKDSSNENSDIDAEDYGESQEINSVEDPLEHARAVKKRKRVPPKETPAKRRRSSRNR